MSIWYQDTVHVIAKNRAAVAKFFKLEDSFDDVRTDMFEFSFGGKNAPSLTLRKIVQENPDLIFLVKQTVEVDTEEWFLTRFDVVSNQQQFFWIQDFGQVTNKVSKKLLEDYAKDSPTLVPKHLNGEEGYEKFRWTMFINDFDKAAKMLNHAEEYKEMVNPWKHFNVKMYVVEFEFRLSDDGEWHKEWEGPMTLGATEKTKKRLSKYSDQDFRNFVVKEVEPK